MSLDEFFNVLQSPTVEGFFLRGMTGVIGVTVLGIIMGIVGLVIRLLEEKPDV